MSGIEILGGDVVSQLLGLLPLHMVLRLGATNKAVAAWLSESFWKKLVSSELGGVYNDYDNGAVDRAKEHHELLGSWFGDYGKGRYDYVVKPLPKVFKNRIAVPGCCKWAEVFVKSADCNKVDTAAVDYSFKDLYRAMHWTLKVEKLILKQNIMSAARDEDCIFEDLVPIILRLEHKSGSNQCTVPNHCEVELAEDEAVQVPDPPKEEDDDDGEEEGGANEEASMPPDAVTAQDILRELHASPIQFQFAAAAYPKHYFIDAAPSVKYFKTAFHDQTALEEGEIEHGVESGLSTTQKEVYKLYDDGSKTLCCYISGAGCVSSPVLCLKEMQGGFYAGFLGGTCD